MPQQDIEVVLVPWLEARDTRLADKVFPLADAKPGVAGPYCTHSRVTTGRYHHLAGYSPCSWARLQLDFWSTDDAEARAVASKVAGDQADPGLDRFRGDMGGVFVHGAIRVDSGTDSEVADDGTETVWHRVRADYELAWKEGD